MNIASSFTWVCTTAIFANVISMAVFLTGEMQFSRTAASRNTQQSLDTPKKTSPARYKQCCDTKLAPFSHVAGCQQR